MGQVTSTSSDYALHVEDPNLITLESLTILRSVPLSDVIEPILSLSRPPTTQVVQFKSPRSLPQDDPDRAISFISDPDDNADDSGFRSRDRTLLTIVRRQELAFHFKLRIGISTEDATGSNRAERRSSDKLTGLTFVAAASKSAMDKLLNVERRSDPNLSNRPNVVVIPPTSQSAPFIDFTWTFAPPPFSERSSPSGWRTYCAFVSFDPDRDCFKTMASFCIFVQKGPPTGADTPALIAGLSDSFASSRAMVERRPSHTSSRLSASAASKTPKSPHHPFQGFCSPSPTTMDFPQLSPYTKPPTSDTTSEDGPLFRATLSEFEKRCCTLRKCLKTVHRGMEGIKETLVLLEENELKLDDAFAGLGESCPAAWGPLRDTYTQEARLYEVGLAKDRLSRVDKEGVDGLGKVINRLKEMEAKKKQFDAESKTYYDYSAKYLAMRSDASGSEEKFVAVQSHFALARLDYYQFLYSLAYASELSVLSHLTSYATAAQQSYCLGTQEGRKLAAMTSTLTALQHWISERNEAWQGVKTEFEEQRRSAEVKAAQCDAAVAASSEVSVATSQEIYRSPHLRSETNLAPLSPQSRSQEFGGRLRDFASSLAHKAKAQSFSNLDDAGGFAGKRHRRGKSGLPGILTSPSTPVVSQSRIPLSPSAASAQKFTMIPGPTQEIISGNSRSRKKEGFLYSLNRPISHQATSPDPSAAARHWHKFWCVLAGGMLSEYRGWREGLELHGQPINLRFATVREARGVDRRFTFEVVTFHVRHVYQATSDVDAKEWMRAITASIESLLNGTSSVRNLNFTRTRRESIGSQALRTLTEQSSENLSPDSENTFFSRETPGLSFAARLMRRTSNKRSAAEQIDKKRTTGSPKARQQNKFTGLDWQLGRLPEASKSMTSVEGMGLGLRGAGNMGSLGLPTLEARRSLSDGRPSLNIKGSVTPSRSASGMTDGSGCSTAPELEDDFDSGIAKAVLNLVGSSLMNQSHGTSSTSSPPTRHGGRSIAQCKIENANELARLVMLPGNDHCIECNQIDPRWCSYNLGIFLCIRCSGLHRGLGSHVSKVRSIDLDDWSDEQMIQMREVGNIKAKEIWEAHLPPGFMVTDSNVAAFVRAKYADEVYKLKPIITQQVDDLKSRNWPTITSVIESTQPIPIPSSSTTYEHPLPPPNSATITTTTTTGLQHKRQRVMSTQAIQSIDHDTETEDGLPHWIIQHARAHSYNGLPG